MRIAAALSVVTVLFLLAGPLSAHPVNVFTRTDAIQDDWSISGPWDELGFVPPFEPNEALSSYFEGTTSYVPCPSEYKGGTNVVVAMTNLTPRAYRSGLLRGRHQGRPRGIGRDQPHQLG